MRRAMASMSASVCSATEMALPPGVFITRTPAAGALCRAPIDSPAQRYARSAHPLPQDGSNIPWDWKRSRSSRAETSVERLPPRRAVPQRGLSCVHGLRRDRNLAINVLDRGDPGSKLHRVAVGVQDDLELRNHCEQIREIEVAQMRDAEDLPLHGALPVGDHGAETVAKLFHDYARIHAGRRFHGGHRGARRMRREQLQ